MAVRPQHMHDGGIMERRLRPIYDWLDNGNNKKALQEAEKVLKKSPSLQAARALKALALFRLGKAPEAHAVLDALANEKPSDDTTLQAMTITYRESQQLHKVCALYEAAVKAEPTSEELHSHLFMSYVRIGDYRAQQRAAMALYKFTPKNPYYFWAVMSIVLQAKTTDDSKQKGILLTLAQRMVDNFITENKMEAEQEARLYIMILELQEKWEDILKFIEGPLYSRLVPGSTAQACIAYLKKLNQWRRINVICKELLWENQDRWDYYLPYFESVFELMKEGASEEGFDNTPEKCHEFICQIVESVSPGRTLRGPYLARLELYKRLSEDGDPSALLGSVIGLLLEYLRVFAHKPCAVPDLRPYFPMVPQKEREEHARDFLTCLGFDENSEPDNTDDIQRHISCLGAWRLTAAPMAGEESLALADTLRRHYLRCLNKGLVSSTLTEFCAADGYSILAAHQYFYAAVQLKSAAPVVEALGLLELALHHSPSNFHAKLLLVTLYHLIGNAMAADSIYQRLEMKHIQLVSLGWLHAARLQPACAPARALQLLADTRAFHSHHAKDSVEHLTYAYKYGTFEKLVELVGWSRRLFQCAFAAACARERALAALLAGPPAPPASPALPPPPHHPTDNRDINVILNWDPPQLQDPNLKTRTFERDLVYLRLKDCLVSAIALCIECSTRPPDQRKKHYDELKVCLDLWRFAFDSSLDKYKDCVGEKEITCISAPFPSRIIAFVNSPVPYRDLYSCVFGLAGELCAGHAVSAHLFTERAARLVAQGAAAVAGAVGAAGAGGAEGAAGAAGDLWALRDHLETLANFLEFIGVVTFVLGVCHELVAPANAKKPKKKPNHSPDELKTNELLNKLNETVQTSIATIEGLFINLPKYNITCSLEEEFAKLNIRSSYHSTVEQKLKQGQADMIIDIKNILKKKTKYLKTLLH